MVEWSGWSGQGGVVRVWLGQGGVVRAWLGQGGVVRVEWSGWSGQGGVVRAWLQAKQSAERPPGQDQALTGSCWLGDECR